MNAKVETEEIDILQMELDHKLPHWLDPTQRDPELVEHIRNRNRARWIAAQKARGRQKRWQHVRAQAEAILAGSPSQIGQDVLHCGPWDESDVLRWRGQWDESEHPRVPAGSPGGGQFTGGGDGGAGSEGPGQAEKPDAAGAPAGGGRDEEGPRSYGRRGPSDAERSRHVAAVYALDDAGKAASEAAGITALTFHELTPQGSAQFSAAIEAAKGASKYGASVYVYPGEDYQGMRLFLTPDGQSGFALKGDDIVSAFKHPDAQVKGFANSALALATQEGGRRLDAFDTVLPELYSDSGFRAVARLAWDDGMAPPDWDQQTFAKFNGGRPDVVFMVYDPDNAQPYQPNDGQKVESYDAAVAAQSQVLERLAR